MSNKIGTSWKDRMAEASPQWKPLPIKYKFTNERYTSFGTYGLLADLFAGSPIWKEFTECLPRRISNASYNSCQHALTLLGGLFRGDDCLEDLDSLRDDPGIEQKLGEAPSARALSDWIHDHDESHVEKLKSFLIRMGFACRKNVHVTAPIILDLDSTSHEQAGKKMEGLAYNYKNQWCLDSLESFDELGFCYGYELRAGNTFSSEGAPDQIRKIFRSLGFKQEKYFRADSAFCNQDCISAAIASGAKLTVTAHGNTGWEHHLEEVSEWKPWQYSEDEIKKAALTKQTLPRVEVGFFIYKPGWSENLHFPIVVKRTELKEKEQTTLFHPEGSKWKYWGVLTNFNLNKSSPQQVLEHHAKRGNSENFIREGKYNYDLKHFPCQSLRANQVYALYCMIAHNFARMIAILYRPDKPNFMKKLRRKLLFLPGKVIHHAGQIVMKIPMRFKEEVMFLTKLAWTATQPTVPIASG